MNHHDSGATFGQQNAASYDNQREKLAPIKDALHLCMRMALSKLPEDARILCVGAGTGAELIYLAEEFPEWHFTVVEPAPAMLKVCRQRVEQLGIAARCTFHEGYLGTLPQTDKFDAATSILVSHFLIDTDDRRNYFSEIASRLRPGAYMVNADLAFDLSSPKFKNMADVWISMHDYADMPVNIDSFGRNVALLATEKVEAMIKSSGFDCPILFFQTLFIHAWVSELSA